MERIQSAIQKAKEQRSHVATQSPGRRPAPAERGPWSPVRAATPLWSELPAFAPDPEVMRQSRIVTFERSDPAHANFDMMRTKALRLMRDKGWTSLGITSPTAGCGKTTVSLNLAFSLARQIDTRTVLMDVDLRRPAVARHMGLTQPQSMASVLQGTRGLEENFVRCGENLAIGTSARGVHSASEILQHRATGEAIAAIREQFRPDVILYDLPPMLANDDVIGFLPHIDCVLLVAAAERSRLDEIEKCEQELVEHGNLLGILLNKCRYIEEDYGYY
jgi:protein-tyrosine kinase